MFVHAAEGEGSGRLAVAVDHTVAGDVLGVGIHVQGVAHHAAPSRVAREHGDLSVGRDLAARDFAHHVIDQFKGVLHSSFNFHYNI